MKEYALNTLEEGESAVVTHMTVKGSMRRRLMDIGLIPGTCVECVQKSPAHDPVAYLIRGALIALRSEDSARVLIEGKS